VKALTAFFDGPDRRHAEPDRAHDGRVLPHPNVAGPDLPGSAVGHRAGPLRQNLASLALTRARMGA
jgi:hypothetical protein